MNTLTISPGEVAEGIDHVGTLVVLAGATVNQPKVKGMIVAHPGSCIVEPIVDADGGKYGIETSRNWPLPTQTMTVAHFLKTRTILDFPTVRGAANKALLLARTEVRGGVYEDLGNDVFATEYEGWVWFHGLLPDKPVRARKLGNRNLDPKGHSDGGQPFAPATLIEGDVQIDLVPFGAGYEEAGAGFFLKADFGPLAPVYIRNGVHVRTQHGYGLRVVRDGTTGLYPGDPIVVSNVTFERLDGKHPIDVPAYVQLHDVRDGQGNIIGRFPK